MPVTDQKHRSDVKKTLACKTKTERQRKESELGWCIMLIILTLCIILYLGTAKYLLSGVWQKNDLINSEAVDKNNIIVLARK